ncbi:MAG: efflux RND transporter periplasmic adaptor subunit [Spirochaetales bacterium]|nr:efflux RND transporter periplasmic adaptor subunit [Spirochaetales bacterium]
MNKNGKLSGDRLVQIILLVLIAAGIATFPIMMKNNSSGSSAGGPPGMSSGRPSGPPPGAAGDSSGEAMGEGSDSGRPEGAPEGMSQGGMPGSAPSAMEESTASSDAVAVEAEAVSRDTVREYIKVNGDVVSASSVNVYPDIAGELVSVNVSLGERVVRGQTVAVVDPSQPGQVYSNSDVTAPISGTVTAVSYDRGENVSTSDPVVVIGDLDELEIVTYIPERYVASVEDGLTAEVYLDAYPEETFYARVTEISPVIDSESRSQEISLAFIDSDSRVIAGMFSSLKLIVKEEIDVITIPELALTTHYDEDVVYVIGADNTAERRSVEVGLISSDLVQILSGLEEGDMVVTRGLSNITDGAAVNVVN